MLQSSLFLVLILYTSKNLATPRNDNVCDVKNHPFVVAVVTRMLCGGTLLKMDWVLTAAHCAEPEVLANVRAQVRAGFTNTNLTQTRLVKKAFVHPNYDMEMLDAVLDLRYDIALLKLNQPFEPSVVAQVVTLPTQGMGMDCSNVLVAGTGKNSYFEEAPAEELFSRPLRCVNLNVITEQECKKSYQDADIDDTVMCTMGKGNDTCVGNSGAPLICNGFQVGILSLGAFECGESNQVATYTKVEKYLDFINQHLASKK